MVFSDMDSDPTSVFSGKSGTRWLKSPAAIFAAVFSIRFSGASVLCTTMVPRMAPINTTAMPTMAQNRVNVLDVSIWSLSDNPMNTTPLSLTCPVLVFSLQGSATTRHGDCAACMMA